MPDAIKIQKCNPAEQLSVALKGKHRLGVLSQKLSKSSFRHTNPRNFAVRQLCQICQLIKPRRVPPDCGRWQKTVQVVSCYQIPSFSQDFVHLWFPVSHDHT